MGPFGKSDQGMGVAPVAAVGIQPGVGIQPVTSDKLENQVARKMMRREARQAKRQLRRPDLPLRKLRPRA